jgi:anti-anti-sigma regulatory factor
MATQIKLTEDFFVGNILDTTNLLLDAFQREQEEIVVDMTDVTRIDSAAIQTVLSARKEAEFRGVTLTFILSETVKNFASAQVLPCSRSTNAYY